MSCDQLPCIWFPYTAYCGWTAIGLREHLSRQRTKVYFSLLPYARPDSWMLSELD